ncbi:MAG: rhodanese-like domain-containing protein [Neomegalonema sp.]|nr:rhodanese-like domain-containing protein [Neomegalonema sp.]
MAQHITKSVAELVAQANAVIEEISVEDAKALYGREDVIFVDIRDIRELGKTGRVPGAFHAPRGMLEFWVDPASPYHKPIFGEEKTFVFFCAGGLRSALATKAVHDMGLRPVKHIRGGFGAWKEAGGAVEEPAPMPGN